MRIGLDLLFGAVSMDAAQNAPPAKAPPLAQAASQATHHPSIRFEDAGDQARVNFTHSFGSRQLGSLLEGTGAGCVWLDYNNAPEQRLETAADTQALREGLLDRLESVLLYLFPSGRIRGNKFYVGDIDGAPGKSLVVELDGPRRGLWKDFADDDGGDDQRRRQQRPRRGPEQGGMSHDDLPGEVRGVKGTKRRPL